MSSIIPIGSNIPMQDPQPSDVDVTYFGLIRPMKGIEQAVSILKSVSKGRNLKVRVVGQVVPAYANYASKVLSEFKLIGSEIILNSSAIEASDLLSRSKIALLPFPDGMSRRRGSALAAMGNGALVVTTAGENESKFYRSICAVPAAGSSLEELLSSALDDYDAFQTIRSAGQRFARSLTWAGVAGAYTEIIHRMQMRICPNVDTTGRVSRSGDKACDCACRESKLIVYAAFKGMGDLLNAAPVLAKVLQDGHKIKLLLFPGYGLENIVQLLDFGPNRANLELVYLPVSGLPQTLFWRNAKMAGIESEHFSFLFDVRIPVSRELPMMEREQVAFAKLGHPGADSLPWRISFVDRIRRHREELPTFDLIIHPGANAPNRRWPWGHFAALVRLLPRQYRIAVLGVPADIERAREVLPKDQEIQFLAGTLEEAITAIASTRVLFSMDSGAAHFANCLGVPTVALFGKSDPASIIGYGGKVYPLYERKFPCQPCGKATCHQPEVYCMNSVAPQTVARALLDLMSGNSN
jgi:heptosyltransferase-2